MNKSFFRANDFFDSNSFEFKDIFSDIRFVWEVLPKIGEYLESLFSQGILVGNYKGKKNVFLGEGSVIEKGAEILGLSLIHI